MPNFAVLEQRLNRVAASHLSNASAVWFAGGLGHGTPVPGLRVVFDREGGPGLDGLVNDFNPVVSVYAADMPGAKRGDYIEVSPDNSDVLTDSWYIYFTKTRGDFSVLAFEVSRVLSDGTGLLVLHLVREGAL